MRNNTGFTLLELLFIAAVIAILLVVAIPQLGQHQDSIKKYPVIEKVPKSDMPGTEGVQEKPVGSMPTAAPALPEQMPMSSAKAPARSPAGSIIPTPAPSAEEHRGKSSSLEQIPPGAVFFEPKKTMRYKEASIVTATIFRKKLQDVKRPDIAEYYQNYSSVVGKPIRHVGETMVATLTGPEDIFKIEPKSGQQVAIDKQSGNSWRWFVTPLKHRDSTLVLRVFVVIGNEEKMIQESEEKIYVHVTPQYFTDVLNDCLSFIEGHKILMVLLGSGGIGGWLLRKLMKRKKGTNPQP